MNFFEKIKEQEEHYFRTIESFLINGNMNEMGIKAKTFWRFRQAITLPMKHLTGRM